MPGQSHGQPFTGAHPTNREFVEQLAAWGFTRRKEDGVHLVFRAPHGGTLRVIRSLLGRADTDRVAKAARLVGVTTEQFWAGPERAEADAAERVESDVTSTSADTARRRRPAAQDRVTSLVLGVHAEMDRPLGFDQIVDLLAGRVTRGQVRTASAQLCREGDLDRIRSGVYQWSGGARSLARSAAPTMPASPPTTAPAVLAAKSTKTATAQLFSQLFPSGVRMTAELLDDLEQWAELTERIASHARAS